MEGDVASVREAPTPGDGLNLQDTLEHLEQLTRERDEARKMARHNYRCAVREQNRQRWPELAPEYPALPEGDIYAALVAETEELRRQRAEELVSAERMQAALEQERAAAKQAQQVTEDYLKRIEAERNEALESLDRLRESLHLMANAALYVGELPMQALHEFRLNPFAVQLLVESYQGKGEFPGLSPHAIRFAFCGVQVFLAPADTDLKALNAALLETAAPASPAASDDTPKESTTDANAPTVCPTV